MFACSKADIGFYFERRQENDSGNEKWCNRWADGEPD